jgi:hypothetical protein
MCVADLILSIINTIMILIIIMRFGELIEKL